MHINLSDPITQIVPLIMVNAAAIAILEIPVYRVKKSSTKPYGDHRRIPKADVPGPEEYADKNPKIKYIFGLVFSILLAYLGIDTVFHMSNYSLRTWRF